MRYIKFALMWAVIATLAGVAATQYSEAKALEYKMDRYNNEWARTVNWCMDKGGDKSRCMEIADQYNRHLLK